MYRYGSTVVDVRILFLTNFYPPHVRGGMELSCQSVVQNLSCRGHECQVLTSYFGYSSATRQAEAARLLHLEMDLVPIRNAFSFFTTRVRFEADNRKTLRRCIGEFRPDVVFVWGMWNLHRILVRDAEEMMGSRVLYRFGDYWPSLPSQWVHYWQGTSKKMLPRLFKTALRPVAASLLARNAPVQLSYPASYCISHAVKNHLLQLRIPVEGAKVIHNGIDLEPYRQAAASGRFQNRSPYALAFVGRLMHNKGAHVAIEALARLIDTEGRPQWRLTVIGSGDTGYVRHLEDLSEERGVSERVVFLGQVPSTSIPSILARHSVLVVPSLWEEPFGRVVIEGMAAGCVVVGSEVGALPEIIESGETGILFPPGDAVSLANSLQWLVVEPAAAGHLATNGHACAVERYSTERMVDEVELFLERVVEGEVSPGIEVRTQNA